MNKFPLWKNILVILLTILGIIYALPNIYGEDPSILISNRSGLSLTAQTVETTQAVLKRESLKFIRLEPSLNKLLVRFSSIDTQLRARDLLQQTLGDDYIVASNLAPSTPIWLSALNAKPMKYGLDLQGGVHFLLQVDLASVVQRRVDAEKQQLMQLLRDNTVRYTKVAADTSILQFTFKEKTAYDKAYELLTEQSHDFLWQPSDQKEEFLLSGTFLPQALRQLQQNTMEQTLITLRNRVNELGISEPIVQQQGIDRIAVDLPGVQDTARAEQILGKTATVEFRLVDEQDALASQTAAVPSGAILLYDDKKQPHFLKDQIILKGSAIINAQATVDEQTGRPAVSVRLGGGGDENTFAQATAQNVGKLLAVVYIESKPVTQAANQSLTFKTDKKIIEIATINSPLGNAFQITGMPNMDTARDLALLLRAGSLPTSVAVIESRIVGASLGQQNIAQGEMSVIIGLLLIAAFMIAYYRFFGLIATIGLLFNLVMIVAILSVLGATLTLPSIAGIVLTVGMAIDANVLINERIREELRAGAGIQLAIHAGYERAFATILDSNVTTLIVALVLLAVGTGPVQGFAVTLTVGILTSLFTAITVTRSLVNAIYGGKSLTQLSIGINIKRS